MTTSLITAVRFWATVKARSMRERVCEGGETRVLRRTMWVAAAAITLAFNLFWCQAMVTYSYYVHSEKNQPCERLRAQYVCILASVYLVFNSTLMVIVICLEAIKARLLVIFLTIMTYAAFALTACFKADDIINRGALRFIGPDRNCTDLGNSTDSLEDPFKTLARFNWLDNMDLTFMAVFILCMLVFILFMLTMMGLAIYSAKKENRQIVRQIRMRRELREAQRQARLLGREYGTICLCQAEAEVAMPIIHREEIQLAESVA